MLYGAGNLIFVTQDLATNGVTRTEELLYPGLLSSFELTADTNLLEAKALVNGIIQTVAAQINEEVFTLSTVTQFADWTALQFGYNEVAQASSNVVVPVLKSARVPSVAPFEIADADIAVADVLVYKASLDGTGRFFFDVVSAAPANEREVQAAAGVLTFDSSLAGQVVQYRTNKTYASIESIGVEQAADSWGRLEFWAEAYGTEFPGKMLIRIPLLSRISTPSLAINGSITELSVEFRASVPTGARRPFELYDLTNATEA